MSKLMLGAGGSVVTSLMTGVLTLHGPGLVLCAVLLSVLTAVFVFWVVAITCSASAAEHWSTWRASGVTLGPSP